MMKYYDFVLGLIPAMFISAFLLYFLTGLSWTLTVPSAAAVSALVIGHALFINPPITGSHTPQEPPVQFAD